MDMTIGQRLADGASLQNLACAVHYRAVKGASRYLYADMLVYVEE